MVSINIKKIVLTLPTARIGFKENPRITVKSSHQINLLYTMIQSANHTCHTDLIDSTFTHYQDMRQPNISFETNNKISF